MIAPFAALACLSPSLVSLQDRRNHSPCALVSQALSPFMIAAFASLAASSPSWQLPSLPLMAYLPVLSPCMIADFAALAALSSSFLSLCATKSRHQDARANKARRRQTTKKKEFRQEERRKKGRKRTWQESNLQVLRFSQNGEWLKGATPHP